LPLGGRVRGQLLCVEAAIEGELGAGERITAGDTEGRGRDNAEVPVEGVRRARAGGGWICAGADQ